jgi:hypothetical protein
VDFSTEEQKMLAAMVRYQRGKINRRAVSEFVSRSPLLTNEILILISLLRIVLGLNTSRSQKTQIQALQIRPEMLHIVVRGPHADSDANIAQKNAKLWAKVCHQSLVVEPAEETEGEQEKVTEKLPFPALMKTPGLGSWDPMAEAGRKILRYHFAEMLHNEAGTVLGEDIEALHDMRVATRRMRAAFGVFADAYEPDQVKPYIAGRWDRYVTWTYSC